MPNKPTNLRATPGVPGTMHFEWDHDPAAQEWIFKLNDGQRIHDFPPFPGNSYQVDGFADQQVFEFTVTAVDAVGVASEESSLSVTTPAFGGWAAQPAAAPAAPAPRQAPPVAPAAAAPAAPAAPAPAAAARQATTPPAKPATPRYKHIVGPPEVHTIVWLSVPGATSYHFEVAANKNRPLTFVDVDIPQGVKPEFVLGSNVPRDEELVAIVSAVNTHGHSEVSEVIFMIVSPLPAAASPAAAATTGATTASAAAPAAAATQTTIAPSAVAAPASQKKPIWFWLLVIGVPVVTLVVMIIGIVFAKKSAPAKDAGSANTNPASAFRPEPRDRNNEVRRPQAVTPPAVNRGGGVAIHSAEPIAPLRKEPLKADSGEWTAPAATVPTVTWTRDMTGLSIEPGGVVSIKFEVGVNPHFVTDPRLEQWNDGVPLEKWLWSRKGEGASPVVKLITFKNTVNETVFLKVGTH